MKPAHNFGRWFRFYARAIDDLKVQGLSDALFKTWVNILCVASDDDGAIPDIETLSFRLRLSRKETEKRIAALVGARLIDNDDGVLVPHDWDQRQFSDHSKAAARIKKYRDKREAAGLTRGGEGYAKHKPALMQRDGGACVYCGSTASLCIDHEIPFDLGGTDDFSNLVIACRTCNSKKGSRTPEQAGMKRFQAAA